jgi:acyl-CoA-binding protein/ribosomal protein S18 acetylase RimI-like enzyme
MEYNYVINKATEQYAQSLVTLLNSAYRGESAKKGWTNEADLISGEVRTNEQGVLQLLNQPGSVILICTNNQKQIVGCVNLQKHNNKLYLGMLAVSPLLQGTGIGKKLLHAAEEHAKATDCDTIYMTVISVRAELIDWYKRHGYTDTGERKPFPEDDITGKHLQELEFAVLEKSLIGLPYFRQNLQFMDLQQQFEEAIAESKNLSEKPSNDTLLQLYSLYKQGSEGDVNIDPPANPFDFVAKAKYEAWVALKGKSKEEAIKEYIDLVSKLKV